MSPLKLAQKKRIQKDSLLMFHVKTTASLTTKPIYFPLESWEGATTNNETAGFRCLRKKLPAEQLLVEGFEVPLWHFTERHFRNPGMFVGMFVYCASGTCSFYVFFWLEQQLCCHKHVFFVLQVGDVSCFILFVQVWKDRSVDVSTFLMCVFVFPYFELEWLFLFQGMDDSRTWASSKVHSPPQKKTPTTRLMFNLYSQPIIIYLQRTTFSRALSWVFVRWTSPGSTQYRWSVFKVIPGHLWP